MGFSVHWSWLAAFSCLLCMGGEVWCNCIEAKMEIEGGDYILTRQLQTGSLLIYQCPEGYYPYPAMIRHCQRDGSWRPAPTRFTLQRCRLVECPAPNVLEYGNVFPPQERYFVNNETTFECDSGHTMRGSSRRVCLPNGKWSGSTTICSYDSGDHCADPGIPPGASRIGNEFGIGDTVHYTCIGNQMILVGSSERECQEDGHWTGQEPACYYQHTYDTTLEVSQAFGSAIMGSLTTLQSTNDTVEGRKIRLSKNGTLNIYIAVDISESIEKDQIEKSKEAIITLITKISAFSVTPNYEILFFSSKIFEVVKILDFLNGEIKRSDIKKKIEEFPVIAKNTAGTNLHVVFKKFEEKMGLIKQRVGNEGFKEHRHVIIIFTDGAYNMGGSPESTVKRIKNMVYMNNTGEKGTKRPSREEYLDIYAFGIGLNIDTDVLQKLTVGTGGNHFFKMKTFEKLNETFDDIIDEEEVRGLCGLYKYYGEETDQRRRYPWLAYIVAQINGKTKTCLGSLVSPRFVLTSAHCLPFGVETRRVKVEIDDGQNKGKSVKKITRHPKYNVSLKEEQGVKEFYDYDVALIQLEEDIKISNIARPICIPCTQQTSDALQLVGASTCLEQEQLLFKDNIESLTFLTKERTKIYEKDVRAKLGMNRDECIRHALEAEGITTTNPRDAVTDNFLCTGGTTPFHDHIACQGDSGGAVYKNYELRTIQVAIVTWGTKDLCGVSKVVKSEANSRDFHLNLFRIISFLKPILGNTTQNDYTPLTFLKD